MASSTGSPAAKRPRSSSKLIVTHSGTFHADEALAVYLVRKLEQFRDADLVRTRDAKIIDTGDIVLDVGGVYDPSAHRYDHHQRGFDEKFSPDHATKLSSAGLVYKHFGRQILEQELAADGINDKQKLDVLYTKLYENFVEALDGIDNGIQQYEGASRYSSKTDLSSRVAHLNPSWNESSNDAVLDSKFEQASTLAGTEFDAALYRAARSWYPARSLVVSGVTSRKQHDVSGRLVVFEDFAPWKEHLFLLEQELKIPEAEQPFYVIYPDESGKWRVQAVPISPDSFQSRKPLPEAWRGIRDQALSDLTGIPGCIFVHASGFIGGNATREGALEMVKKALIA